MRSSKELAAAGPATETLATASKGSRRDSIRRGQTIISRLEGPPELAFCALAAGRPGIAVYILGLTAAGQVSRGNP
jgi:hypothetical protein